MTISNKSQPASNFLWSAKMISPLADAGVGTRGSFVGKKFNISELTGSEEIHISALGLYRCFINGKRVGDDLLTPGWVNYDDRLPFQNYQIHDLLKIGENVIEIWLADGWYRSQLLWKDDKIFNCWGDQIAAIAEISNDLGLVLLTDDDWFSGFLPILKSGIYFGETFDARQVNLVNSHGVKAVDFSLSKLVPHECPPVSALEPLQVVDKFEDEQGRMIYDFGQNIGGFVRILVNGQSGAEIFIEHSEILGPNKAFDNRNLRSAECEIKYILSGDGNERYEAHFTFQGFRYARVTIKGDAELVNIQAIPISSLPNRTANFSCGNPLVNRLVENTIWSQRANFIEVPTDCPQRDERLGWSGDAQVFAPTACYLADSHDFLKKYLKDLMVDQRSDGAISHVSPDPTRLHPQILPDFVGSTGWGDAIVIIPWTLYTHYADKGILEDCYDAMCRWLDFVWSISDGPIVYPPVGFNERGFSFGDWLQPKGGSATPNPTISTECAATLYHYISTQLVAKIAKVLGKTADEERFSDRAQEISQAFANEFITPSGRLANSDQTSYSLAFLYDLIPSQHIQAAKQYFRKSIELTGGKIGTGFIGTPALLPALTKIGVHDLAEQVFLQKDVPGWLYQIEQGATTIWERWDALAPDGTIYDPEMNSYNHYAYGAVCQWLFETVAGIAPSADAPGFDLVVIDPHILPQFGYVEMWHDCFHGRIEAAWTFEGRKVLYKLTLPEGCSGRLVQTTRRSNVHLNESSIEIPSEGYLISAGHHEITFTEDMA